jgi:RNA polymerase sigma-70 factor (sigma-E family)
VERIASDERRGAPEVGTVDPVEFLRGSYPALLATARRLVGSQTEAEDLVQEALIETLSRYPDFTGIDRPLGYVRTVLYRSAFARWRLRRVEVPTELPARLESPEGAIEDRLILDAALETLGERQRACVALRYLHGLDDREIASVLGCRASTVRSQLARGLARLRERMEEFGDADG